MSQARKRDWSTRDFIEQAKERGYTPDIAYDLDNLPTLPDSEEKDPAYERGFYVGKFSDRSLAELKSAAYDEMMYQQWKDFQNKLNDPDYEQAFDERPTASFGMQDAFSEVMKMTPFNFAHVILSVNDGADFEEFANQFLDFPIGADPEIGKDAFLRDGIVVPCWVMKLWGKLHPLVRLRNNDDPPNFDPETAEQTYDEDGNPIAVEGMWRDRLMDAVIEEFPDNYPCLVTFTRKIIYGASLVFVKGDDEPGDNTLLGQTMEAQDAATFDPRVAFWLEQHALRPDDGWLTLTIPQTALKAVLDDVYIEQPPPGGEPGAGTGDPGDPFSCGDCGGGGDGDPPPIDPTDPPPGVTPPGPGSGTPGAPGDDVGFRATWECGEEIIFNDEGTNTSLSVFDFSYNQEGGIFIGLGLQGFMPVQAQSEESQLIYTIKDAVEAWRVANSKPGNYTITRVELCVSYQRMRRVALLLDGEQTFLTIDFNRFIGNPVFGFTDPKPRLRVQRGSAGSDKLITGEIKRLGNYAWVIADHELDVVADVELAEDKTVTISEFQTVTGLVYRHLNVPAKWDFWNSSDTLPTVEISLKSADVHFKTSKFSGHFNYANDGSLTENPNVSGQMKWFSDIPDGLVSGMIADYTHDGDYPGAEIASGQGPCVLIDTTNSNGNAGTPISVELLNVADGYVRDIDAAYTNAHLRIRGIGGAQTWTLNINVAGGGGGVNFTQAVGDFGSFGSVPYTADWVEVDFDISSLGLDIGDPIYYIQLSAQIYLFEWYIALS